MRKEYYILIGIIIILIIPIIINEINMRPKLALISDVKEIVNNIENYSYTNSIREIIIDNGYTLDKTYKVKGKGVIFLEDNYSVMLSRNGMCAMKMPYNEKVMFQNEECPNYRLIDGEKMIDK